MTDIQAQQAQARQAQAQQAQAQQAQAQQAQVQRDQAQAQVSVPVSTRSSDSSDGVSSDGVNSEIGKLRAEKDQYERIIKTEISKFESDLIGVCSNYGIKLPSELKDYNAKIYERKNGEFCIPDANGKHLSGDAKIKALRYIEGIKNGIMRTGEGKRLFETHENKNIYREILDFAIICISYQVTVDNYVRLLRIIDDFSHGKKLLDYIANFNGIEIGGQRMDDILDLVQGKVTEKINRDRDNYTPMFKEEGLDINTYFPVASSA